MQQICIRSIFDYFCLIIRSMKIFYCKFLILIAFSFSATISAAKPLCDSLFKNVERKIVYAKNDHELFLHLTDTSGWEQSKPIEISDIIGKNQVLLKQKYEGSPYINPTLLIVGYTGGFEIYRDSMLIYSALDSLSTKTTTHFFDSHFIPLIPPLDSSVFVIRIPFNSYLDVTSFRAILIGEAVALGKLAVDENRKAIKRELQKI